MRKAFILAFFLCLGGMLRAQNNDNVIAEGDVLVLGEAKGSDYRYIDFPKKNIIIKRGAIANFKALIGKYLVVHSIETDDAGNTEVVLKRKDGINFFRFFPKVEANLTQAMASGELMAIDYQG